MGGLATISEPPLNGLSEALGTHPMAAGGPEAREISKERLGESLLDQVF